MELRLGRASHQLSARLYRPSSDKEAHRHQGSGRHGPVSELHEELPALQLNCGCSRSVRVPLLGQLGGGHY